tara:strand:- start:9817 stop:10521 length:705 start_codon:yes stop_codon:yes gene_type:complete
MTIFSAGCSFSDIWEPAHTSFGKIIANRLNQDYNNEAVESGSSNDRIFRVLTQKIIDKEITSKDTILLQYTDTIRREFCSWIRPNIPEQYAEKWNDYWLVKYFGQEEKHLWTKENPQFYIDKKDLLQALYEYRVWLETEEYDFYIFNQRHLHFQTFLSYHNIKNVYFLLLNVYCDHKQYNNKPLDYLTDFENNVYEDRSIGKTDDECYSLNDRRHLNQNGHNVLADRIYKRINK